MRKIINQTALLSLLFFSTQAAYAGIVFTFGNNITTERRAAFEAAADEIEQMIDFKQDVKVSVSFDSDLECDDFGAVLGYAGPTSVYRDFAGAPQANTWYVSAQAADMGLADAMDDTVHISAAFNHRLGAAGCLTGVTWYFGTDHNPGSGQIDFLSTAVHEFMHGLGFLSLIGSNGATFSSFMDNYSSFLFNHSTSKSWTVMTNNERAASILNNNNLVWNGAKTMSMVSLLQNGVTSGRARLFAPTTYESGSSTSHFDTSLLYDTDEHEVMEPYSEFPESSIMASAVFCDMGWGLLRDTDGDTENDCDDAMPLVFDDADGDGTPDALDAFPNDPTETTDTDGDGIGDNSDVDADNDGINNGSDNCPTVSNANQLDYDSDGTGDACGDDIPMEGITGAIGKDKAGSVVAFAGDVDADNYGDYVVGIPGYDIPPDSPKKAVKDAGRAVVVSGKTGQVLFSISGVAAKDAMGATVAGGADIDDDGFDDVVVGAPRMDNLTDLANKRLDAGSVTVLYGPDGERRQPLYGAVAKILFGTAVALGDVNDDGFADIVVGVPKDDDARFSSTVDAGSVRVFSGDPADNYDELIAFYGSVKAAYAGSSVAVGYVDTVAGADVIIGAPKDDFVAMGQKDNGSVTVYNFHDVGPVIPKKYGIVAKALLGTSVASGDVNNDGRDDVVVGAPGDDNGVLKDTGSVTVFSGNGGTQLTRKTGAVAKAGLGNSVTAGDVDGDGKADIIAGAMKDDVPATSNAKKIIDAGSVSIWRGNGYTLVDTLYGAVAKDYFGVAVSAGDINSDGKDDVLVGIAGKDIAGPTVAKDAGAVEILSGVAL